MSALIENEITQEDLDITHRTLLSLVKRAEKKIPWQIKYIQFLEEVSSRIPADIKYIK